MVSPAFTVKPSVGSKNISKGLKCEETVMYHFTQMGWKCIGHRKKLFFSEVDLVLAKDNKILLIEVKSLHDQWMAFERVPHKQIQNLIKNKILYQVGNPRLQVECRVCFVLKDQIVEEVYID